MYSCCYEQFRYYSKNETYSQINDHGTTHLSIVDAEGNAAAMTTTINLEYHNYFG